jgi:hypothetical protein
MDCAGGPLTHAVDWALLSRPGCGQRRLRVSAWNPCQVAAQNVDGECSTHKERAYPEAPVTMHSLPVGAGFGFTAVATIAFMVVSVSRHLFSIAASYSQRRAA